MGTRILATLSILSAATFLSFDASAATPLTQCGQVVSDAVLTADLDCSATQGVGVTIEHRGKLDLAGFTLTGGNNSAVACNKDCTVVGGGGTVTGASSAGIVAIGRLIVSDVTTTANGAGISGKFVEAQNVTSTANQAGAYVNKRGSFVDCTLSANSVTGIGGDAARAQVTVTGSTLAGNKYGIVNVRRMNVSTSQVTDSAELGVAAQRVRIDQSTVTGSGTAPGCNPTICADITAFRLNASAVTCDTSAKIDWPSASPTGETWDICAED